METYKPIDLDKYENYDEIRKGIFEYRAINPENILCRDNHNTFFAKRSLWSPDLHVAEHLANLIGKKTGFRLCETDLYVHPQISADFGVISYSNASKNDILLTPISIIEKYLNYQNISYKYITAVDIDTVFKAIFWFMYQYKRPYSEFEAFKQDFINMTIFDLKLLNPDRNLENWFIRQDTQTKAIDLYPMFDNEMCLGFDKDISIYKDKSLNFRILDEDLERTSAILTPESMFKHENYSDYRDLFKFLLTKYPTQTQIALNKFQNFDTNDLSEILNQLPNLTEERKKFVIGLFYVRTNSLNKIIEEHNLNKKEYSKMKDY